HPVILQLDTTSGSALQSTNQDYHHNVGVNFEHRWPLINVRSVRWVNNFAYNGGQDSDDFFLLSWGGLQGDLISNKVVYGPNTVTHVHPYLFQSGTCKPQTNDEANNCPDQDNPG